MPRLMAPSSAWNRWASIMEELPRRWLVRRPWEVDFRLGVDTSRRSPLVRARATVSGVRNSVPAEPTRAL